MLKKIKPKSRKITPHSGFVKRRPRFFMRFPVLRFLVRGGTDLRATLLQQWRRSLEPGVGDQLIMNEQDEVLGREKQLLISATDLSLEEATALVHAHGGAVYPAHIDRRSNGLLAILGDFPARPVFSAAELHDPQQLQRYRRMNERYRSLHLVSASDAHRLCDISEGEHVVSSDIFPVPLDKMEQDAARRYFLHWLDDTFLLE